MTTTQPCGGDTGYGCGKPVQPGRGRPVGAVWWHQTHLCQSDRRRVAYIRRCERRGVRPPLPLTTCGCCGRQYQPQVEAPIGGSFCARQRCNKERARTFALIRGRAWMRIAAENPIRMAELMAEEAARITTEAAA